MTVVTGTTSKPRSLTTLWLLITLFALPPALAWLFYANPQWLPAARNNQGTLIDPPRSVQSLRLSTVDGGLFDWRTLQGQWTLALFSEGGCDAACIEALIEVRQIRRATGANRQRIERLLILLPDRHGDLRLPNLAGLEGTLLAISEPEQKATLLERFPVDLSSQTISLYLIDPRGELMMSHDTSRIPAKQILQDLNKLLNVSQSWVKGGQYGHR
jgi:cytochrome oxidase Cu insertion factor (SCO1/SenC/PrrC family)